MNVEAVADLSVRTIAFDVEDAAGEPVPIRPAFPPLGVRANLTRRGVTNAPSLGIGFYTVSRAWDTDLVWAPTTWTVHADFGWRHSFADAQGVGFHMDLGGGPRLVLLQQPWWEDYLGFGLGEHLGVGYTFAGRWMVDARVESAMLLDSLTGTLDSAAEDLHWTWQAAGIRLGVGFGRAF